MFKQPLSVIVFCGVLSTISADTIPGGDVSGMWYAANSPYYITGDITIPVGDTLTIEPGVWVDFLGFYSFTVNGFLEAVGTEADSIHFFSENTNPGWEGIRLTDAPDSSHLAFCAIRYAGWFIGNWPGAIVSTNSNPVITHCRISDNTTGSTEFPYTGGISLNNSNAIISSCDIVGNRGGGGGGGIYVNNSSPLITGCDIRWNKTFRRGGGIYVTGSSYPVITGCTIDSDTSNMHGGGISVAGGVATISDCTIADNKAHDGGGGIAIFGGSVSLDRCTFEHNQCWVGVGRGGGVFINGGTLSMDHCTLFADYVYTNQYGMEIYTGGNAAMTIANSIIGFSEHYLVCFESSTPPSVSYSDFYIDPLYPPAYFYGNIPSGLGQLTQVNYNGDSCDVYYNIYLDPLFVDWWNRDYHLTAGSPCIDAGDPLFAYDPDSTITDMGRYFFDQSAPSIALSVAAMDFGSVTVGLSAGLPLVIYNIGNANLLISDISNNLTVFAHDWSPLDSIVLPGDSLGITVTFTPDDTLTFTDTCWIANNDSLCCVTLVGQGLPVGVAAGTVNIPHEFALRQPLPNPCKSFARLQFELPKASVVSLSVYDVSGRLVSQLINGSYEAGIHDATLNASRLSAGVYFYRLKASGYTAIRKVIVTK